MDAKAPYYAYERYYERGMEKSLDETKTNQVSRAFIHTYFMGVFRPSYYLLTSSQDILNSQPKTHPRKQRSLQRVKLQKPDVTSHLFVSCLGILLLSFRFQSLYI